VPLLVVPVATWFNDVDAMLNHHLAAVGVAIITIPAVGPTITAIRQLELRPLAAAWVRSAIIPRGWQKPRSKIEISTPVWWYSRRCLHSELDGAVGLVNHLRWSEPIPRDTSG
jgi:hypothetical protein